MASNEIQQLVSMANDIAANLASYDDCAARTAEHIKHFWPPRMRDLLFNYVSEGGIGLSDSARHAVGLLRDDD